MFVSVTSPVVLCMYNFVFSIMFLVYSQVPNKQGGQNKRVGGKFLKILINGGGQNKRGGGNFLKNLINT